jgi:hypothetical protein
MRSQVYFLLFLLSLFHSINAYNTKVHRFRRSSMSVGTDECAVGNSGEIVRISKFILHICIVLCL